LVNHLHSPERTKEAFFQLHHPGDVPQASVSDARNHNLLSTRGRRRALHRALQDHTNPLALQILHRVSRKGVWQAYRYLVKHGSTICPQQNNLA
jgi:hypothetical protein